jgi:hypothetical protein
MTIRDAFARTGNSRGRAITSFVLTGFARIARLDDREEFFRRWLEDGRAG